MMSVDKSMILVPTQSCYCLLRVFMNSQL